MDPSTLAELPDVVPDLVTMIPVEALPLEALPAVGSAWLTRVLHFFSRHALLLAFFGALIENTVLLGFLLPGGTVVALSGAGARNAGISLPLLIVVAGLGMTGGAVIDYYLGRAGVHQLLHRRWTGKIGKRLAHQLHSAEPLLRKHGWWVMLFAHAFGHGRSTLALAAGASGFPLPRFLLIEIPAAMLWSAMYAGGGYLLAAEWQNVELLLRRMGWIGAAFIIVGGLGYWLWHRHQAKSPMPDDSATLDGGTDGVPRTGDGMPSISSGAPAAPITGKTGMAEGVSAQGGNGTGGAAGREPAVRH